MARIISFVLCENIQPVIAPNGNGGFDIIPNIVSPLAVVQPVAVPGNYSFSVFGTLCDIDSSVQNTVKVHIIDPDGNETFSTGPMNVSPETIFNNCFNFSIDLRNFVFWHEGKYCVNVSCNEEIIFSQDFEVLKKKVLS